METLKTDRLVLRPFELSDFEAIHAYASHYENIQYMQWGPNTEAETRSFIHRALSEAAKEPIEHYEFAVVLRGGNQVIGACNLSCENGDYAEVGWILHRDHWKNGYGTELASRLLRFGFDELGLLQIGAHCAAENYGSYRVMERNGMRREGHFIQNRPAHRLSGHPWCDEYYYAILKSEWEASQC